MSKSKSKITPLVVTSVVILGGMVGATAILFPGASDESASVPTPEWNQSFEPIPEQVEVAQDVAKPTIEPAAPTEPPKPNPVELAIAHSDLGVDYGEKARTLIDKGDLKGALVAIRKHLHTNEASSDVLLILGRVARQVREFGLAEAALEKGISEDPTRADLAVELARVHLSAGHGKKAEAAARRALRVDRENAAAWNQLGRAAMAQSRWQLAELAYNRAIHLEPVDGFIQNNLGLLFIYMKKGMKAVEALERAVELMDDETPYFVFNNLGLAHEIVGQNEEAREAFEEALLLNPFYTRAKVNLDRVEAALEAIEDSKAFQTASGVEPESVTTENPDDA